jgi:hypothetical protein
MKKVSHYPTYDVLNEKNHWDDHTQSIVTSRMVNEEKSQFLTMKERQMLKGICTHLTYDDRKEIIQFVIDHIDQSLASSIGEGQRKQGVLKADFLVREGLRVLNEQAKEQFLKPYAELEPEKQQAMLEEVSKQQTASGAPWGNIKPTDFFKKLLTLTVEAYCSYPTVWSEMGYGGPAYPRGYIRTQMGQLDPWEAQPER